MAWESLVSIIGLAAASIALLLFGVDRLWRREETKPKFGLFVSRAKSTDNPNLLLVYMQNAGLKTRDNLKLKILADNPPLKNKLTQLDTGAFEELKREGRSVAELRIPRMPPGSIVGPVMVESVGGPESIRLQILK